MIITKQVLIRNNGRIKSHYRSLGLNVDNEFIEVPIELVTKGSQAKIDCLCDICGKNNNMSIKDYNRHISYDNTYYCIKCSMIKKEEKLISKYGVSSYTKTTEFKNKSKKTCIEKYGSKFYQSSDIFKSKIIETCLEKYGCRNVMQTSFVFNKQNKSSFNHLTYKDLTYQGTYELDFLENYINKHIITKIDPIKYELNDNIHYYHPDFYLPEYNLIIEIKSSYTYNYDLEKNLKKKEYCLKNGYNFLFIIDKNYSLLDEFLLV